MKVQGLFAITVIAATLSVVLCSSSIVSEEFIKSINAKATTWTARNNFPNYTTEQLKALAGVIGISRDPEAKLPVVFHETRDGIPESFDSRLVWPECDSLRTIRNQGACGSYWAFASVEVMSDRLCISTAGEEQFTFSPEELVSCCTDCGDCSGGNLVKAFNYWKKTGIPSGGDYESNLGCRPYTAAVDGKTPACNKSCVPGYDKDWASDIRHGITTYEIKPTADQMQREILINGPIATVMELYEDFYSYGSGIYQYTSGYFVGHHAVKIIGWGLENNITYWIIANSWGTQFGEDGYFRIIRGKNNVNVEYYVVAGTPKTSSSSSFQVLGIIANLFLILPTLLLRLHL